MAVYLKLCISDHILVKPKCVLEAVVFFNFRKFVFIFQLFVYNFSEKTSASQTHFGFTNIGSEMHSFRGTAIWNYGFWFGSPCTYNSYKSWSSTDGRVTWRICKKWVKWECGNPRGFPTLALTQQLDHDTKKRLILNVRFVKFFQQSLRGVGKISCKCFWS